MKFRWKVTPNLQPKTKVNKITLGASLEDLMSHDAYKRTRRGGIKQMRWSK